MWVCRIAVLLTFIEGGGRVVGENKALTSKKSRFNPYQKGFEKCRICKTSVHQSGSHYCQACAYKKGMCVYISRLYPDVDAPFKFLEYG